MSEIKFPDVHVAMVGQDGNAFAIIGRVIRALRQAGHGDQVDTFTDEATSGDYSHLLATVMDWVSVDDGDTQCPTCRSDLDDSGICPVCGDRQ